MNFGFLARCGAQGVRFYQVGEEPPGGELMSGADDDTARVLFLGRLYYRDDLRRRLDARHRPAPAATAAAHVLAAYRQAGSAGLEWLEGDYAFALWDGRGRRLVAGRDPLGGFPLFWVRHGEEVVVSNAMRPLLDLLPGRTLDRAYLAEFLVLPGCGVQELHDPRCVYEGVHRVVAGTRVEVRPGGEVRAVRWWDWEARIQEPASLKPEAVAAGVRTLLNDAVQERRVGQTACDLSGGMDSTGIALLAARQAHRAGEEPVHGLSLVYQRLSLQAREKPYIDSARGEAGLVAHPLPADDWLDFDVYRSATSADEPVESLCESTASHALIERAAQLGARTHMSGFGADDLFQETPALLYDLLRRGRWLAAWRESARWAGARSCSRWDYLGKMGLRYFLPAALRNGLGCWWRQGRVGWERQTAHTIGPWVRPEFARRFGMWPRIVDRLWRFSPRGRPLALALTLHNLELAPGDGIRWELGVPRGLFTVHPFQDPRLVSYCLGWQGRLPSNPHRQKPILADALHDVLPPVIRDRPRKGQGGNETFFQGLARNRPLLEALVQRAPVDELELLDKAELIRCLQKAALGVGQDAPGVDRLSLTLCLLKWLTTQEEVLSRPGPPLRPLAAAAAESEGGVLAGSVGGVRS
jgi:asparagine synthase (glutamine-hydrolysing)